MGSPTTSCQPAPSIHTASASSATSAHIADLQHQVTLKSLALQTLQSEYASLLQKLQRERVKSQTIEKKTSVADQEVNDLTSRNEDLTEQIKALEAQLEECEKKRESERLTATSERDQWTKLLALDRQLQSKNAEEKQKLREEKSLLSQRVAAYEDENFSRFDQLKRNNISHTNTFRSDSNSRVNGEESNLTSAATPDGFTPADATNNDVESLKAEVMTLKDRVEMLRYSLEEAKRRHAHLGEKSQEIVNRHADIAASIDRALEHDDATAKTNRPDGQTLTSALSPTTVPEGHANSSRTLSQSTNHVESSYATQTTASSSTASMSSIARAVSPGPAELGFHVVPSTSTPEELIAALGPVPSVQFVAGRSTSKRSGNSAQRKKPRKRNPDAPSESNSTTAAMHYGAFRPLEFQMQPAHLGTNQSGYLDTPIHSYASSPGSMAERSSPSSSGSNSRRSSGEEKSTSNLPSIGQSPFTTGLPSPSTSADGWPASVMPPPPRPSMNLRDLCSMPTGSIARP
jgi:predicted  nucleic acid-binding Zn-ribbon protein